MATLARSERDGVAWWWSPSLEAIAVPHGFSTRHGGVSRAPFDSLNLGRAGGVTAELSDPQEHRTENLRRFQRALGLKGRRVVRVHQVHGASVVEAGDHCPAAAADRRHGATEITGPTREQTGADPDSATTLTDPQADAIVGRGTDAALMVTVADCAPVLLACPTSRVIAAVHAGWRGVVAGVVPAAIERMRARGARVDEIRAAIGPCIGPEAFEVGDEVVAAFVATGLDHAIRPRHGRRSTIDLVHAVTRQLSRAGVNGQFIDRTSACTWRDAGDFFSYRRDGARSGRMAAMIAIAEGP